MWKQSALLVLVLGASACGGAMSQDDYLSSVNDEFDEYRLAGVSDDTVDRFWLDFADTICWSLTARHVPTWDDLARDIVDEAEGRIPVGGQTVAMFDLPDGADPTLLLDRPVDDAIDFRCPGDEAETD